MDVNRALPCAAALIISGSTALQFAVGQSIGFKREQAQTMLADVSADVAKHYYDPTLRAIDWDAKVRETKKKIENATSSNLAYANIAALLDNLDDSHTFFIPPPRSFMLDYGWRIRTIGERCFVTRIRPESDVATKIHLGDEILEVNDYKPTRANLPRIEYILNVLRPQNKIKATVRSPAGEQRQLEIIPKVSERTHVIRGLGDFRLALERLHKRIQPEFVSFGDVLVVKILVFALTEDDLAKILREARKHRAVIFDLRGCPGGSTEVLRQLVSRLFDHEVKIADQVTRDSTKPLVAKPDHHAFTGKLTVLVDSQTASAAEVFSRVVQLEKRGVVMGDLTSGKVMEAARYGHAAADTLFGVSVTVANLLMSDGKSLERVGVAPDERLLPEVDDLVNQRDPVLAHAVVTAGAKLSPEEAGRLFPYVWQEPD